MSFFSIQCPSREPISNGQTLCTIDIYGGHCSGSTGYQTAIEMLTKQTFPVDVVVTHDLPLRDCVEGIQMVNSGALAESTGSIKVVLDPTI